MKIYKLTIVCTIITIDSCMYQSLKDFAILRSLNLSKSSKFCNFRKSSQNFVIAAVFPQFWGLDASRDVIVTRIHSKKGCFSVWKMERTALRSHHAWFTRATSDKRTERGTNPRYSFGLRPFICSDRSRGMPSITWHRYTQRWEIQWRK